MCLYIIPLCASFRHHIGYRFTAIQKATMSALLTPSLRVQYHCVTCKLIWCKYDQWAWIGLCYIGRWRQTLILTYITFYILHDFQGLVGMRALLWVLYCLVLYIAHVAWYWAADSGSCFALRDQSYSLVICSEEFNIPAACGGCSSRSSSSTVLVTVV